ncbi:hypothetical protein C7271_02965 [filamentous cyanobacterium CCP5]|nr:hypothetical protein C7271_02965 [filamentous cyanobacterium CCP5]
MPLIQPYRFPGPIALVSLLTVVLWGCGVSSGTQQTHSPFQTLTQSLPDLMQPRSVQSIQQVTAQDSNQGSNQPQRLAGVVNQHIPLVERWLYQIQDESGSLWVLTQLPPPPVGSQVTLEATIGYEPIMLGEADIGEHYAVEIKRLEVGDQEPIPEATAPEPQ